MKHLKRIIESITGRPRGLTDDNLLVPLPEPVFVNRGYSALPRSDITDDYEVFREVYRVEDREDWESWFRPFVSRFLRLALQSILRDRRKTATITNTGFAAGQRILALQNTVSLRAEINQRRRGNLSRLQWRVRSMFENYLDELVSCLCSFQNGDSRFLDLEVSG